MKQYLQTKKLHYNKYLFKVKIGLAVSYIFRNELQRGKSLRFARAKLDEWQAQLNAGIIPKRTRFNWDNFIDVDEIFTANKIYNLLLKEEDYLLRCEIGCLFLYTNSEELVKKIERKINTVFEVHKPDPNNIDLLLNSNNIIIVNEPPQYEYKITLGKKPGSPALAKWIQNNPNLAKMGSTALNECLTKGWVKGYYFFVRDIKTLFMIELIVGDNISTVNKLVYNNNIDK